MDLTEPASQPAPGGAISPGTPEQPVASLAIRSLFSPSLVAGDPRLVIDVDAGGRSDTLVVDPSSPTSTRLGGALVVRVRPGYAPAVGDPFTILTNGTGTVSGTFEEVIAENANGAVFAAETAADGRSVVLTVTMGVAGEETPEPGAAVFAVGTLASPSAQPGGRVTLPEAMALSVNVFDAQGRRVARLADEQRSAGTHALPVAGLASGVYVARVVAVGATATARATQRLVVAR